MNRKIVALWAISCLAVSNAKAQFNTVSDNICRYKVKKVEEKLLSPANNQVDSVTANLLQQETDSVDSKQKQWTSSYPSFTYPLKSIKVTSPYGYRCDPINGRKSMHHGIDLKAHNEYVYSMMDGKVEKVGYDARSLAITSSFVMPTSPSAIVIYLKFISPQKLLFLPAPSLVNQATQDVQQASICIL